MNYASQVEKIASGTLKTVTDTIGQVTNVAGGGSGSPLNAVTGSGGPMATVGQLANTATGAAKPATDIVGQLANTATGLTKPATDAAATVTGAAKPVTDVVKEVTGTVGSATGGDKPADKKDDKKKDDKKN